jgi:predicted metal-dependent phosphoesterase TrpH
VDRIKTVFHVHTNHSPDCNRSAADLLECARRRGIGCLAVTDHDAIGGARELAALAGDDLRVIVGEEVSTTHGHVIGLFLREFVEPGMSPRDTALAIKRQGGLVVIPHPFNRMFGCGLCGHIDEVIDLIDVVEVFNSQNIWSVPNSKAQSFATQHGFPRIVGIDMHFGDDLDACHQYVDPFDTPAEFVASLRRADFAMTRQRLPYFFQTAWYVFLDRSGIGLPEAFGRHAGHAAGPDRRLIEAPVTIRSES